MKKLLSIILVVAMLLGMTSVSAFATDPVFTPTGYGDVSVVVGGSKESSLAGTATGVTSYELTDAKALSDKSSYFTYSFSSTTAKLTITGKSAIVEATYKVKVTAKASGEAVGEAKEVTIKIEVVDDKYALNIPTGESVVSVSAKGTSATLAAPKFQERENFLSAWTDVSPAPAVTYALKSGSSTYVTLNASTRTVTGKAAGEATVVASAEYKGKTYTAEYTIKVSAIDVNYSIENGDAFSVSASELISKVESSIKSEFSDTVTVTSIEVKLLSGGDYGSLYGDDEAVTAHKIGSSSFVEVVESGIYFDSTTGAIGDVVYEIKTNGGYAGTLTITVKPYDEIDDEQSALFAKEEFELDLPSGIDSMVIVNPTSYSGLYKDTTTTGTILCKEEVIFDPTDTTKYTTSNNDIVITVVGLDRYDRACYGTITLEDATYDIKYVGEKDEEVAVEEKDFTDLFEDMFDNQYPDDDTYYSAELISVKFPASVSKTYNIYDDSTKLTKATTVDVDDLDDVTIEPLTAKDHLIEVTLTGKIYNDDGKVKNSNYTKQAVILVSAVAGDVKYTVVTGSSVYLDEDDFQDFVEEAVGSSKAELNYIVIDDSDLNVSKEGYFTLVGSKDLKDEKLYYEAEKSSQYEISEARFVASKYVANGTKLYVPFTAYGSKNGTGSDKQNLGTGYIELDVINNPFNDVKSNDYFYNPVLWATSKGITKGTNVAGTLFSPNEGCTRAQAVTFLYRAAGSPSVTSAERNAVLSTFIDVDSIKHKDFIEAIAWAKANGITSGTSAKTFSPDKTCTRAQIVTFIYNYAKAEGYSIYTYYANKFTDVKTTTTHKAYAEAIEWAVENKVTSGTNTAGTLFSPDQTCTRAHIVTFLYNFFSNK